MSENLILDLSMQFAIDVVNLCESLKGKNSLTNQLLRSGTSIGANIREAQYAHGKADFIAKLQIALKEANETGKWLEMLLKTEYIDEATYKSIDKTCSTIRILLIASIKTAKSRINK